MMLAPFSPDVVALACDELPADVVDDVIAELLAPYVPGAPISPQAAPRARHALADEPDYGWLLDPRPTDNNDARFLWVWWRGIGRRGAGKKPRPTVCATAECGREPAPGRRVCEWCAHCQGPRVWREGRRGDADYVEIVIDGPPTRVELERRDTASAYDAWRATDLMRDDVDPGGALEVWIHSHGLDINGGRINEGSDAFDEVDERVDRERAAQRRRRW